MAIGNDERSLGSGYYWVGSKSFTDTLQCNPYLLVEGDEAVLFDPGPVLDFEEVRDNIATIVPLDTIKYVVLHNEDPSLASSLPLFEEAGVRPSIVITWRTWSIIRPPARPSPSVRIARRSSTLRKTKRNTAIMEPRW